MSLVTNVFRRGATYYFRIRVPAHLRAKIGRNELWKSLRTSLTGEARRRCVWVQTLTETLWRDLERAMDLSECKALIDRWLAAEIKEDAYLRGMFDGEEHPAVVLRREPPWKPDSVIEVLDHDRLSRFRKLSPDRQRERLGDAGFLKEKVTEKELALAAQRKVFEGGLARHAARDETIAAQYVRELFQRQGVEVSEFSSLFEAATRMMLKAHADLERVIKARDAISWEEWYDDDPAADLISRLPEVSNWTPAPDTANATSAAPPSASSSKASEMSFSDLAAQAIPEIANSEQLRPKRIDDYKNAVSTFIEWWGGDPAVLEITPKRAGEFGIALSRYPANANKRPAYRHLGSFAERLAAADAAAEKMLLSAVTINGKYLTPLRRIFQWSGEKGFGFENPFAGIRSRGPRKPNPKSRRRDFTNAELQRLFSLPLFVGAEGNHGAALYRPGPIKIADWRFWVPLICVFSGMRLNEACGLAVADIKEEAGIPYFHVRDEAEGQSLKSDAARRRVPVHDQLVDLGFLDFVAEMGARGRVRLFEELKPGAGGYFSHEPSKFLSRLLRRIEDSDPVDPGKLNWHSSRHTVITRLRAGQIRQDVSEQLVGHESLSTQGGYGGSDLPTLKKAVDVIRYEGLDLTAIGRRP